MSFSFRFAILHCSLSLVLAHPPLVERLVRGMRFITSAPQETADLSATTTSDAFASWSYGSSSTSSSIVPTSTFAGDDTYPVFPNSRWFSRMYLVNAQDSGLTQRDQELYNYCYLPFNSAVYDYGFGKRDATSTSSSTPTPRPTYLSDEVPCKRQAAINANCYFQNTNHSFTGLEPYSNGLQPGFSYADQQRCFCKTYPFFDSVLGCQECVEQHGGTEGYHWFPAQYVSAVSSSYCAAEAATTDFYAFQQNWAKTQTEVNVGSTTASNALGSETAMSAYYTYNAAALSTRTRSGSSTLPLSITYMILPTFAFLLISNIFPFT